MADAPFPARTRAFQVAGKPGLEEHEQGRVLAPVGEQGGEADDERGEIRGVLGQHLLADPLGHRVDVVAVRGTGLGERPARRREAARRDGAGEDEAPERQEPRQVEDVAQPLDVGSPVLRVLVAGEVVVGGEVDQQLGAALVADLVEERGEPLAVADVDLVPDDVRMDRRTALALRPPPHRHDLVAFLDRVEEVAADEPRGPGDHDAW